MPPHLTASYHPSAPPLTQSICPLPHSSISHLPIPHTHLSLLQSLGNQYHIFIISCVQKCQHLTMEGVIALNTTVNIKSHNQHIYVSITPQHTPQPYHAVAVSDAHSPLPSCPPFHAAPSPSCWHLSAGSVLRSATKYTRLLLQLYSLQYLKDIITVVLCLCLAITHTLFTQIRQRASGI